MGKETTYSIYSKDTHNILETGKHSKTKDGAIKAFADLIFEDFSESDVNLHNYEILEDK